VPQYGVFHKIIIVGAPARPTPACAAAVAVGRDLHDADADAGSVEHVADLPRPFFSTWSATTREILPCRVPGDAVKDVQVLQTYVGRELVYER
jgi:hypothetical protein